MVSGPFCINRIRNIPNKGVNRIKTNIIIKMIDFIENEEEALLDFLRYNLFLVPLL